MGFKLFNRSSHQDTPVQPNFATALKLFLDHFTYLTSDNRRNGSVLKNFFCNVKLTEAICKQALLLKYNLNHLDTTVTINEEMFLNYINNAIDAVHRLRESKEFSSQHTHFEVGHDSFLSDGLAYRSDYDYYNTYSNGLFEKTLLQGLNAAKPYLTPDQSAQADHCINKINNYHSRSIITADRSYYA